MKIFYYVFTLLIATPSVLFAQGISSSLLEFPQGNGTGFDAYINWLYVFSISVAALLAVVKIIIAGFKYVTSDVISNKSDAKNDIKGALLGLLIILGAYVILSTINPNLVKSTISIEGVSSAPPPPAAAGSAIAPVTNQTPGVGGVPGNTTVTNVATTCQGGATQTIIDNCIRNTINQKKNECANKYGDFAESGDTVSCTLPKQVRLQSSFTKEFDAYKLTLPIGQRVNTTFSEDVFETLCTQSDGRYVDEVNTGVGIAAGIDKEDACVY